MRKLPVFFLLLALALLLSACGGTAGNATTPTPTPTAAPTPTPTTTPTPTPTPTPTASAPQEVAGEEIVSLYRGSLNRSRSPSCLYEITVWGEGDVAHWIVFQFADYHTGSQTIVRELEHYPRLGGIRQGLLVFDVNGDGNEDVLMDLGTAGHLSKGLCLVFDPQSGSYTEVMEYGEENAPWVGYRPSGEVVLWRFEKPAIGIELGCWRDYKIEGTEMVPIGNCLTDQPPRDMLFFKPGV